MVHDGYVTSIQNTGEYGGQETGGPTPVWKQKKPKGNPGGGYSNTMKQNNNIMYCYSCGYNVDQNGWQCHPNNLKRTYIPNFSRGEAHTIAGASMKAQHKTLPGVSGAGKVWILAQQLQKANWVMDQQDTWKQHKQHQQWRGLRLGKTVSRTDKIDKQNLEPTSVKNLYPTQKNTYNRFALIATDEDNDEN